MKNYGKKVVWPKPSKSLQTAESLLKKIFNRFFFHFLVVAVFISVRQLLNYFFKDGTLT